MKKISIVVSVGLLVIMAIVGWKALSVPASTTVPEDGTIIVTDQLGRNVRIPRDIQRAYIMSTHIGTHIALALGQREKLVGEVMLGRLGQAMGLQNKRMPGTDLARNHQANLETILALKPQVVFCEIALDGSALRQLEDAGLTVVAIKGETIEESFAAVRLMAKVLNCENKGEEYINACSKLMRFVEARVTDIPADKRPRVLFLQGGANFTAASGEMIQTHMLNIAGAQNVAADLITRWPMVSPERIVQWQPDVVFLGPLAGPDGTNEIYNNSKFSTLNAVVNKQVYIFPSNIGWWDFPAPHCVLGIVWMAKTIYPDRFADVDMKEIADDFYKRFVGRSFTEMGGKL